MENFAATFSSIDRYDDGISVNYASMLRLWSAFDRSITAFNRKCGIVPKRAVAERKPFKSERGNNQR